jgi:hypothetical protein
MNLTLASLFIKVWWQTEKSAKLPAAVVHALAALRRFTSAASMF